MASLFQGMISSLPLCAAITLSTMYRPMPEPSAVTACASSPRQLPIEDQTNQFNSVRDKLKAAFPGLLIERISKEHEFRENFEQIASDRPDIVVVDVMLPWTDTSDGYVPAPAEIRADGGHYFAGFRCAKLLGADERTRDLVVIIYTVVDQDDVESRIRELRPNHRFVRKDEHVRNLIAEIKAALPGGRGA
jgi:DNA-binding NarL/FixJ family response regulator